MVRKITTLLARKPFPFFLLFSCVLIVGIFHRTLAPPDGFMLFSDDVFRSYGFFREYFAIHIRQGIIPWWNPYLFSGMPFFANPSISIFYPLNWIHAMVPISYSFAYIYAFDVLIAILGGYWFAKKVLKTGALPSIYGGLAFGLCGYFFARIWGGHAETLASIAWIPWVFGAFYRTFMENRRRIVLLPGILLAIEIIAGYQTVALFTLEAVAICAVVFCIVRRTIIPIIHLIIGIGIALCLSAFQLFPAMEFFRESVRTLPLPYSFASAGSIVWHSLVQFMLPFHWGDQLTFAGPPPNYWEQAAFIGVTTIFLSCIALLRAFIRKSPYVILTLSLVFICIFSVWTALGPNAPYDINYFLWTYIPVFRNIRFPARQLLLADFAFSVLALLGLSSFKNKVLQGAFIVLLLIEMIPYDRHFIALKPRSDALHDETLVETLKTDSQPFRVLQNFGCWVPPRDALNFDAVMPYGIFSATGYDPSMLSSYYRFADALNNSPSSSLLQTNVQIPYLSYGTPAFDFLNIKYVLLPTNYDNIGIGNTKFRLLKEDTAYGYRLYENNTVRPRFTAVKEFILEPDTERIAQKIGEGVDLTKTAVLQDSAETRALQASLDCMSGDTVRVTMLQYDINSIVLRTDTPCNALLSTSEVMYPGWMSRIDGKISHIYTSNLAFRALFIPKGIHTITMTYIPTMFYVGSCVTIVTGFLCLVWFLRTRKV